MIEGYDEGAAYRALPDLADAPEVPAEAEFKVHAFEWTWSPHPYILSDEHVEFAAKHFHGELTPEAIRAAEQNGCKCTFCAKEGVPFNFDNHRRVVGMVIMPTVDKHPDGLTGLRDWLFQNEYQLSKELKIEVLVFSKPGATHETANR